MSGWDGEEQDVTVGVGVELGADVGGDHGVGVVGEAVDFDGVGDVVSRLGTAWGRGAVGGRRVI